MNNAEAQGLQKGDLLDWSLLSGASMRVTFDRLIVQSGRQVIQVKLKDMRLGSGPFYAFPSDCTLVAWDLEQYDLQDIS